jgi:hypothetical protein
VDPGRPVLRFRHPARRGRDGGLTSVDGTEVCTFHDEALFSLNGNVDLTSVFLAEVFLAQDTGRKDGSGRGIVRLFGGLRWGWQVQPV